MRRIIILTACILPVLFLAIFFNSVRTHASPTSPSATFTVNSTDDVVDVNPGDGVCETAVGNNVCTLRAAIQETNVLTGIDSIFLPTGIYTLTITGTLENYAATGDLDIRDDLIVTGESITGTVIDGNSIDQVFETPSRSDITISNLTIMNGYWRTGGITAIGKLTLESVKITDNSCDYNGDAGGIHFRSGLMLIKNSIISNNNCDNTYYGAGGILLNYDDPTYDSIAIITNTVVSQNDFGGIKSHAHLTITNSIITGNLGMGVNGAASSNLYMDNSQFINNASSGIEIVRGQIQNSNISGNGNGVFIPYDAYTVDILSNTISHNGIGLWVNGNDVTVQNTSIYSNDSSELDGYFGGGIHTEPTPGGYVTIKNSAIYNNKSKIGGGIQNYNRMTIENSTISFNTAIEQGGGINHTNGFKIYSTTFLTNTTVFSNYAPEGANLYLNDFSSLTLQNSIIAGTDENCFVSEFGIVNSSGNNLEDGDTCHLSHPMDITNTNPYLGPLEYMGDIPPYLPLLPNSPAIDAGDQQSCPTKDQRGIFRPIDGNGDGDAICDIGAFELGGVQPTAVNDQASTTPNTAVLINVLANDSPGDGGVLDLSAVGLPLSGTAVISGSIVLYTPTLDFTGTDVFTYTVSDGFSEDTATISVTVDFIKTFLPVITRNP